jgi:hypothetical protein
MSYEATMAGGWLDVTDAQGTRREVLREGLTRVGGPGADVALAGAGADELHVWDRPPRVVFVGSGARPTVGGAEVSEAPLSPGTRIDWSGASLVYGGEAAAADHASLEEVHVPLTSHHAVHAASVGGLDEGQARIWRRLQAGMLVEMGRADKAAERRWQNEVMSGAFDPDACADEILARSGGLTADDAVNERAARLLRDFLMAPLVRGVKGASRRARQAAKGGVAYVVSQVVAISIYSLILAMIVLVLRIKGHTIDGFLDGILSVFRRG